ncbi:MAG TPA: dTDP-4-amino-4,6-dideoxygalactose transaminase [Bacteroidota bacterium]|nr:dTDP-4-amino-4,6-dideoxygalactose transaminase [Bacteroidota bacterium]
MHPIPFNKPYLGGATADAVRAALSGGRLSGDGPVCKKVEERLRNLFGLRHVLLTTSCTHALEMACMLLRLKPGDEVVLPSFTFVSTANAILRAGATPVFCDIDERTLTIDLEDAERRVSGRTRAIIAVHYAGVAADMDRLRALAARLNAALIEDAAQGVNARYKGAFLGGIGDMGAYSFHDTKNYVAGEGGALILNDEQRARAAEIVREKGTNRANFLRGEVDKYTWVAPGSSYILSDLLAAVLDSQLDLLDEIQEKRRAIHRRYMDELAPLVRRESLRLPDIPPDRDSNYHIFHLLLRDERERNRVMDAMKKRGVQTTFHYVPLHSSPFARQTLGTEGLSLPVTDRVASSLLRLPIYPGLTGEEQTVVIESLFSCFPR